MIDVIIPIKDRDHERLMLCIEHLREFLLINKIIVVDYNSKEPVWAPEELRVEIIRTNHLTWNKAHAINLGVKKSSADYIMTVDCDIIVTEELFPLIGRSLALNNFIVNTNVRRIELNQVGEFKDMLQKSKPWFENGRNQLFNLANGGIQIYSRKFYDLVGGIHEGLGFYSGAMDNFMFYLARINGLNTVDLSMPIFHIEHEKKKELNFDLTKEEQDMALAFRQYKAMYLETMINNGVYKNESKIAEDEPDSTMLDQFKREYSNRNAIIDRAIKEKKDHVKICGQVFKIEKQKPSVLIVVINNYEQLPTYFVWDLFNLYNSTRQLYPDIDIQQVNACEVSLMRNMAIKSALGGNVEKKKYNYVVMLDTDHRYSPHFLTRFLNLMEDNNYEILTGLTDSKKETNGEHLSTQYYKIQKDINTKENCVSSPEPEDKVIQVEASGPVGMLINTKIFKKLSLPYYVQEYSKNEKKNEVTSTGSDLYFCKNLKKAGIKINVDLMTSFPHKNDNSFFNRGSIVNL